MRNVPRMLTTHPEDKNASPMHRLPTVCDGQRDGFECKHYWRVVSRIDLLNPQEVKVGRFDELCMFMGHKNPMQDGSAEQATYCNQYEPSLRKHQSREALIENVVSVIRRPDGSARSMAAVTVTQPTPDEDTSGAEGDGILEDNT